MGSNWGEPFIRKYGAKLFIKEKAVKRTNRLFHQYGAFMLFICYFIPGVRHVAAYLAGITGYGYRKFSIYAYVGAVVWVVTFVSIGNHLGSHWRLIFGFTQKYMHSMLILLLIIIIIAISWYFFFEKEKGDT
ncbi:DedA family protein [Virgibacillus halophilus]|uniref:DedA family protein n=1 Tax=Tigheibacillus halophilus TaxID=361280 RepID=A0ABU5C7D8_9BACI|nr:DedA family protein [Virgibacillus halophilus]